MYSNILYFTTVFVILLFHLSCFILFSSVQSLSRVQLFETPWTAACQASLSINNSRSLLRLMPIDSDSCFIMSFLMSLLFYFFNGKTALQSISYAVKMFVVKILVANILTGKIPDMVFLPTSPRCHKH